MDGACTRQFHEQDHSLPQLASYVRLVSPCLVLYIDRTTQFHPATRLYQVYIPKQWPMLLICHLFLFLSHDFPALMSCSRWLCVHIALMDRARAWSSHYSPLVFPSVPGGSRRYRVGAAARRKRTPNDTSRNQNEAFLSALSHAPLLFSLGCRFLSAQGKVNVGKVDGTGNKTLGKRFGVKVGARRKQLALSR